MAEAAASLPFERLDAMVAAQWARTPDSPAIHHRGRTLLYSDLAASVQRQAGSLIAASVARGDLVGIYMERTPDMVAAIVAVLRVGAAYVPIDPGQPPERIGLILTDAGVRFLLIDRDLPPGVAFTGVTIATPSGKPIDTEPLLDEAFGADELACVLYTSGSTGQPKGVALAHTASRYIRWAQGYFRDGELARVAATTSIGFDPSMFEIFAPLSAGGAIVLKENILDPFTEGENPTLMQGVPSAFAELVRADLLPRSLRVLNIGGEPLSAALCRALQERLPACRLFNHYGPTEASICTSICEVPDTCDIEPTLGRPICGARVLILGDSGTELPVGEPGEIAIVGDTLALGYYRQPELTAERFLAAPSGSGERLYRTGDRGMLTADGEIEFLGRLGDQVKVNGVRIELAEVEGALMRLPGVGRAAAAVKPDDNGRQRLVAYVPAGYAGTLPDLRIALKDRLPASMMPSALVKLAKFPVTATGKLDRKKLPAPDFVPVAAPRPMVHGAPDRSIAAIFAQLLQAHDFGVDDDYFARGGDSLLLVEACLRIEELFGRSVPSGLVLQAPTPRLLAEMLRLQRTLDTFEHLVPITAALTGDPIFWACDIHGQAVSMIGLARHLAQPSLGLIPGAAVAGREDPIDLWQLCESYAREIIRIHPVGPYTIAGYSFGGPWAFGVAVCLEKMGGDVTLALVDPVNNLAPGMSVKRLARAARIFVAKMAEPGRGAMVRRVHSSLSTRRVDPMQLTAKVPDFVPESALPLAQRLLAATGAFRSGVFGGPAIVLLSAERGGSERAMNDDGLYGWRALLRGPLIARICAATHEEMAQERAEQTAQHLDNALLQTPRAGTVIPSDDRPMQPELPAALASSAMHSA